MWHLHFVFCSDCMFRFKKSKRNYIDQQQNMTELMSLTPYARPLFFAFVDWDVWSKKLARRIRWCETFLICFEYRTAPLNKVKICFFFRKIFIRRHANEHAKMYTYKVYAKKRERSFFFLRSNEIWMMSMWINEEKSSQNNFYLNSWHFSMVEYIYACGLNDRPLIYIYIYACKEKHFVNLWKFHRNVKRD